jgi:hypothetical protein
MGFAESANVSEEFPVPLQNSPMPPASRFSPTTNTELALPVPPSFSLDEANSIVEIEIQASQLLNYIDKITSFADRACSAAMRQSEAAHLLEETRFGEIVELRRTLEAQSEKIQQQQVAMARLEEQSRAQIGALELRLRHSELQRTEEQKAPHGKNTRPTSRTVQAKSFSLKQQIPADQSHAADEETTALRLLLASREETIRAKDEKINRIEIDFRAKISELEQRLSEAVRDVQNMEAKLKEKELVIRATARKEAEMGKLIQRLSAECSQLSTEMQQRNEATSKPQENRSPHRIDATIWRMIGRMQEEPH